MPVNDFTFVLYPITFLFTMRDDVCASVCEGKAIQAPLQGKGKSEFKNSCPIVRGAWAKEGQKPLRAALCAGNGCAGARGRRPWEYSLCWLLPWASWGWGGLGENCFSMQSHPNVGLQESYSNPLCHPTCPSLPVLPFSKSLPCWVLWLGAWSGARRYKPTSGPRPDKSNQTQIANAQLQFLFPVGTELAEITFFFSSSFQLLTSHELLTHHVTGAVAGAVAARRYHHLSSRAGAAGKRRCSGEEGSAGHGQEPCGHSKPLCCWRESSRVRVRVRYSWAPAPTEMLPLSPMPTLVFRVHYRQCYRLLASGVAAWASV